MPSFSSSPRFYYAVKLFLILMSLRCPEKWLLTFLFSRMLLWRFRLFVRLLSCSIPPSHSPSIDALASVANSEKRKAQHRINSYMIYFDICAGQQTITSLRSVTAALSLSIARLLPIEIADQGERDILHAIDFDRINAYKRNTILISLQK